jgi:6-phosphofructokinase 1
MSMKKLKGNIAVLTSGGDCSGMNAAIRSVVRSAIEIGYEVFGVMHGFEGMIDGAIEKLTARSVGKIINRGGTILKTARSERFLTSGGRKKAFDVLRKNNIEGLIVIGGDGSLRGAHQFFREYQVPVIGIPATIDNDLFGTDFSIGTDTAVNVAMEAIDKIRDTAFSLERMFVIEVMGRHLGYMALRVGLASGAEEVLLPEIEFDLKSMVNDIKKGHRRGKISWIIVVAEGAASASDIAVRIHDLTGFTPRITVLGYVQRGGSPTAMDRILAARLGKAAVDALANGDKDKMVAVTGDRIKLVEMDIACSGKNELNWGDYQLIKILAI